MHAPETITIGSPEKKVISGFLNSSAELLGGYVENGFCPGWVFPGWVLSEVGYVRDGFCPHTVIVIEVMMVGVRAHNHQLFITVRGFS